MPVWSFRVWEVLRQSMPVSSAFGGVEVLTLSIKVLGGFPASELSGNQDADVGVAAPPTFQLCFQAKSSQKSPF